MLRTMRTPFITCVIWLMNYSSHYFRERDEFERELNQLKERNSVLEREFSCADRDKKHFENEVKPFINTQTLRRLVTRFLYLNAGHTVLITVMNKDWNLLFLMLVKILSQVSIHQYSSSHTHTHMYVNLKLYHDGTAQYCCFVQPINIVLPTYGYRLAIHNHYLHHPHIAILGGLHNQCNLSFLIFHCFSSCAPLSISTN